jgi:hypothetical protein
MTKLSLLLFMSFMIFLSCKKEKLEEKNCTCGVIANDGIDNGCYYLEIRNDCSGNKKRFCFDQDIWFNANPGEKFCVQGVDAW